MENTSRDFHDSFDEIKIIKSKNEYLYATAHTLNRQLNEGHYWKLLHIFNFVFNLEGTRACQNAESHAKC